MLKAVGHPAVTGGGFLALAGVTRLLAPQPLASLGTWFFTLVATTFLCRVVLTAATAHRRCKSADVAMERVPKRLPYRRNNALLSRGELAFYEALAHAVRNDSFAIMSKVRLMDLVSLPDATSYRRTWVHRAAQKHVDFVVCHRVGLKPFLIVELDDRTHTTARARKRDEFVDAVLLHSGWPIEHVVAQSAYDVVDLAERVRRHALPDVEPERAPQQ